MEVPASLSVLKASDNRMNVINAGRLNNNLSGAIAITAINMNNNDSNGTINAISCNRDDANRAATADHIPTPEENSSV
jgi:hypothetical protein